MTDLLNHHVERILPPSQLLNEMTLPFPLGRADHASKPLQVEHLLLVANSGGTLHFVFERFDEGIMDDPHIFLDRLPHLRRPLLDGQVAPVRVREPNGLSSEIVVQVRLLRVFEPEIRRFQLRNHVPENLRRRVEEEDAGVEAWGEPGIVDVDVRDGAELEGQVPDFVEVVADDCVRVEVYGRFDAELVEGPNVQFGVLVDEGVMDAFASVRGSDEIDGVEFPSCGSDEA